jgi:hypothetical protein
VWCVLTECDRETSTIRRPWLNTECRAMGWGKPYLLDYKLQFFKIHAATFIVLLLVFVHVLFSVTLNLLARITLQCANPDPQISYSERVKNGAL